MRNFLVLMLLSVLVSTSLNSQNKYTINEVWSFKKGDNDQYNKQDCDISKWDVISIPHTWNNVDAIDDIEGYYRGIGWYRRQLFVGEEANGKQVEIYFEGVNQEVEVYVNENYVGKHAGGYTRFTFDITPFVEIGKKNLIAIKVDNSHNDDIPPLSADFTFFGGIYRDVYLVIKETIHLSSADFASSGIYISTPKVTDTEGVVDISYRISNKEVVNVPIEIRYELISPTGESVFKSSTKTKVIAGIDTKVNIPSFKVTTPMLWSPDAPNIYNLRTVIINEKTKQVVDESVENFGFRWFKFDADKGFFLNGKPLKLIGTNRHQCYEGLGNALPDEMHIRDVMLLKNMGGNFLRIAHYPQDPIILDLCDKLGIVTMVEIPIVNAITESEGFLNNSLTMVEEMVKQNFNHPSLVIWAYMNEVMLRPPFKSDPVRHAQYCKEVNKHAIAIENHIRELDSSRYTLIPFHGSMDAYREAGLFDVPQIIGWNLYSGWYGGTFTDFDSFLDTFHKKYPTTPTIITEYGADVDPRLHSFSPQRFDYTVEYGNLYHEHYLRAIMERPFVAGAAIWNLNDFYSESRGNAVPHVNSKGITGINRELKDTYLLYQAIFLKKPFVAIGNNTWYNRAGVADTNNKCTQPIQIYSNLSQIRLFHNGLPLGVFPTQNGIVKTSIPFANGENTLRAVAIDNNTEVEDSYRVDFQLINKSPTELNIMLGSQRYFEDRNARICWIPEQEYVVGNWGYIGGEAFLPKTNFGVLPASDLNILNTDQDPLFQTQRRGIEAFKADVPNGRYAIYFYWAQLMPIAEREVLAYNLGNDITYNNGDNTIFDVKINNKIVWARFDISSQIGVQRSIIRKVNVDVLDSQGITITFHSIKGKPFLNAVRIIKQ